MLRFILGQALLMTGRGSPTVVIFGYAFVVLAGLMMLWPLLSHGGRTHDGANALTLGIGLLPCPLTISVLGFAWLQSTPTMVAAVLLALAVGIAATIAAVALAVILTRRAFGVALADRLPALERGAHMVQAIAGVLMATIGVYMIVKAV